MTISKQILLSRSEKQDLHSVLRRALERAERNKRTAEAEQLAREIAALDIELSVEQHNAAAIQHAREQSAWRDTFEPASRRFLLPREPGKPLVDPDAERLAGQVGALTDELGRVG
jgi:hypothetical protein